MLFAVADSHAAGRYFQPGLAVSEIYSDNINLESSGNEDDDLVSLITPFFSVQRDGPRLQANANYRMQNLIYANDSSRNATNHQLRANATAQLLRPGLYLDARALSRQQNIRENGRISLDNISRNSNRSDVVSYGLSPYWRSRFGRVAEGEFRYRIDKVEVADSSASDSEINRYTVKLENGRAFNRLTWDLDYDKQDGNRQRSSSRNANFERAKGEARYGITSSFSIFGQVGHQDNSFSTVSGNRRIRNGSYWTYGGIWRPNRKVQVRAGYGRNTLGSVRLSPSSRSSMEVGYQDNKIGLNRGARWFGTLSHRTRNSNWRARYSETTTTVQRIIANATLVDADGLAALQDSGEVTEEISVVFDPEAGLFLVPLPSLTDEVFERKRATVSVSTSTGKSRVSADGFYAKRTFLESNDRSRLYGATGAWTWRFATRTRSTVRLLWRRTESANNGTDTDLTALRVGLVRQLGPRSTASVRYRWSEQDSDDNSSDYTENRISVRVSVVF